MGETPVKDSPIEIMAPFKVENDYGHVKKCENPNIKGCFSKEDGIEKLM